MLPLSKLKWPLAVLVVLLAWCLGLSIPFTFIGGAFDLEMGDYVDQAVLIRGLKEPQTFADTLKWWVGPWLGESAAKFYRPLTSLVWWLEFQVFGEATADGFLLVHFASHLLVCFVALGFLRRVIGGKVAGGAVALWASGLLAWPTLPTPLPALGFWKDDPDMWVSASVILSLWALLSFWRTGNGRFWGLAVGAQLVAIAFKEMSYILPFLAALLLWHQWPQLSKGSRTLQVRSVLLSFGVVGVAFVFRFWALQGFGFRFGSNNSWFYRFAINVLGGRSAGTLFGGGDFAPLGVALLLICAVLLLRRQLTKGTALTGAIGAALVVGADVHAHEAFNTFNRILTVSPWWAAMFYSDLAIALVMVLFWWQLFARRDRTQLFGWAWVFLAYLPLTTAPITEHALYIVSLGWAICAGSLLVQAATWVFARSYSWVPRLRTAPSRRLRATE